MDSFNNKKRKNNEKDQNQEEEDYNIYYDKTTNTQITNDPEEIINIDFLFSEIRDTYFFGIKGFLEGLLNFDEFNSSELADIILSEKDFLGTVIKTELEEESGNQLPDLYALVTFIPFDFFPKSVALHQIQAFIVKHINSNFSMGLINKQAADEALYLLSQCFTNEKLKIGLFLNERASNLPYQLVGPLLNLLREDIGNYKEANDNFPKYDFTHIIYITKHVKKIDTERKNKKSSIKDKEEILYYKFDDEYFINAADFVTSIKVPYDEKNLENIENKSEPVYKTILIIKAEKFNSIVDSLIK